MVQKLRQAGVIKESDYQDLAAIRQDLDHEGIAPDQRVNLVDMYAKKLKSVDDDAGRLTNELGASGYQSLEAGLRRRVDWLQKLSAVHASPAAATVNTLA